MSTKNISFYAIQQRRSPRRSPNRCRPIHTRLISPDSLHVYGNNLLRYSESSLWHCERNGAYMITVGNKSESWLVI